MNWSGKLTAALAAIIILIAAAVAIEGFAIHRLNERLQLSSNNLSDTSQQNTAKSAQSPQSNDDEPVVSLNRENWDPFKEMEQMSEQMNKMFDDAFGHFKASPRFNSLFKEKETIPSFDIRDNGSNFVVTVDVPGMDQSRINVKVEDQTVSVSGSTETSTEENSRGKAVRKERHSGTFRRSITLPEPVKADEAKTASSNGVLRITIPKEKKQL